MVSSQQPTHIMTLDAKEARFLSDAVSIYQQSPPSVELCDDPVIVLTNKLAGVLLETAEGGDTRVAFTPSQIEMLWEVTKTTMTIGSEPIGLALKLKIAEGKRALAAKSAVAELDVPDVMVENEPGYEESLAQAQSQEVDDGKSGKSSESDEDDTTRGGTTA